jgi:hypothetical protein
VPTLQLRQVHLTSLSLKLYPFCVCLCVLLHAFDPLAHWFDCWFPSTFSHERNRDASHVFLLLLPEGVSSLSPPFSVLFCFVLLLHPRFSFFLLCLFFIVISTVAFRCEE